jgi:hypothetical protein
MNLFDDEAAKALKEQADADAAKNKMTLATANGLTSGSFSLTSLHAQAVGLHSIKGKILVELALDTGVHR